MTGTVGTDGPARSFLLRPLGSGLRPLLAGSAVVAAAVHVPVIGPHLAEAPYMGALFIVLTVGCLVIAAAALVRDSFAVYALAVVTCGPAALGYAATRLVAFPMLGDEVGNWLEPLGIVAVVAELVAVGAALTAISSRRAAAGG